MSDGTVRGKVSVNPRGFGFLEFEQAGEVKSAFIVPPDLNRFLEGDIVSATVAEGERGRFNATKLELVERARRELFGSVVFHGKRAFVKVDRQVSNTDWPLEGDKAKGLEEGAWVIGAIDGQRLLAARVLGRGADVGLERVAARHGLRTTYSPALLEEAEKVAKTPRAWPGRRDLRDLPTLTIDAPVSRDLDDALSVLPAGEEGALRVFISIADVDAYVAQGSPLDLEAEARGTSVYLTGRVLPMLPEVLCNQAISLVEGEERPTLTVELRIDDEGTVTSVDLYESVIRSHARLSYDAVAAFLSTNEPGQIPAGVLPTLRWLRTAAARLSTFRASRGGIELLREEATVTLAAGTNEPTSVIARADNDAHRIVERLMVAGNEAVARWLVERGLPGVYRVHEAPDPDRVETLSNFARNFGLEPGFGRHLSPRGLSAFEAQFLGSPSAPALRNVLGKVLGPARYTVHPSPHFGLAAPLYLHFTSPIRRYADLTVHRLVKRYLAGERSFVADDPAVEELARRINDCAWHATKAEMDTLRMMAARLFANRVGEAVRGNVIGIKPFGLVVQITGTGVTGTVATEALPHGPYKVDLARYAIVGEKDRYSIGDALDLTVAGANEDLGRIDLVPRARPAHQNNS